jgi:hypothetical protein
MHVASRSYARALRHVATCLCVAYTHTHTHTHTHRSRSAHGGSNDWRKGVHGASICMASAWRRAKRLVQVHASIHARVHLDLGGTTRRVLAQPLGLCPSHPAWSLSLTSCLVSVPHILLGLCPSHPASFFVSHPHTLPVLISRAHAKKDLVSEVRRWT